MNESMNEPMNDQDPCPLCETDHGSPDRKLPTLAEVERRYVKAVVRRCGGNRQEAAKVLDIVVQDIEDILSGEDLT